MDRFRAFNAFAKVVELGSFAAAAERLELSTSAVSRQVAELEANLETRLLNRTTRRLSLTEAGQAFYERCVQLLADLEETEAAMRSEAVMPRGTLRITCGVTFGERYLAPAVADFAGRHPQVAFDIDLSDRAVDLVDEGFDLAIRIGPVGAAGARGAPASAIRNWFAARRLRTLPSRPPTATPDDLLAIECLAYTYAATASAWAFEASDGTRHTPPISFRHRANNGTACWSRWPSPVSVSRLSPTLSSRTRVRDGRLVRVLPNYQPPRSPISAVYRAGGTVGEGAFFRRLPRRAIRRRRRTGACSGCLPSRRFRASKRAVASSASR